MPGSLMKSLQYDIKTFEAEVNSDSYFSKNHPVSSLICAVNGGWRLMSDDEKTDIIKKCVMCKFAAYINLPFGFWFNFWWIHQICQVSFIDTSPYHKSEIYLKGIYIIQHNLLLDSVPRSTLWCVCYQSPMCLNKSKIIINGGLIINLHYCYIIWALFLYVA